MVGSGALWTAAMLLLLGLGLGPIPVRAQAGTASGEWHHYGGDLASSRYSPLNQVNRGNVAKLEVAWRWTSPDGGIYAENPRYRPGVFKPTPLMVDGLLYVPSSLGVVAALDPGTGEVVWQHDPRSYEQGRPANAGWQHRGVEAWRDGDHWRIVMATHDRRLISLDAKTGEPVGGFGADGDGWTDLSKGLGREISVRAYTHNSPPVVCGSTIVVGSIVSDGATRRKMPPGHVRGYDARTGKMKWIFHTIPQQAELGVGTWEEEAWEIAGNTNVWTTMSCDAELGTVYLPVSTPTSDWYGGYRLGDNLFAESIVALDAETGERKWHFQAVHHGLWDYDLPCAPNLVDITVDGRKIKALAQVSKQGFTYVLDRETGEPVWPIEERPVPPSRVPGERASPTQPHPTKPPPFERQGVSVDDLIDFTPELRRMALDIVANYELGPLYTPPILKGEGGKKGTLMLPSAAGGANWRGAAFDPETGLLYVPSMTLTMIVAVSKADPNRSDLGYTVDVSDGWLAFGPDFLPIVKPPWGRITAIDLNQGEIAWQVAHGEGPRDHPLIAGLDLPRLGSAANGVLSNGGAMLTKELLFVIQAEENPLSMMRMGSAGTLSAFDKTTGELLAELAVEPTPHGNPMTYLYGGRQYVVIAVGGESLGGGSPQTSELVAFALPDP